MTHTDPRPWSRRLGRAMMHALRSLLAWRRVASADRAVGVSEHAQVNKGFTRAVQQLGHDKLQIRLGGIYSLEGMARQSRELRWPVMSKLTAFARDQAPWKGGEAAPLRPDIQAVVTVLGRRDRAYEQPDQAPDLRGTDLRRGDLAEAHLERADLTGAHLERAELREAHLERAGLTGAHLERASLWDAHLQGASLGGAHLELASLWLAHLERAFLGLAHLERANLWGAYLEGAHLEGAHLEGAFLVGATGLTAGQLAGAFLDEKTRLPAELRYDLSAHLERQRKRVNEGPGQGGGPGESQGRPPPQRGPAPPA